MVTQTTDSNEKNDYINVDTDDYETDELDDYEMDYYEMDEFDDYEMVDDENDYYMQPMDDFDYKARYGQEALERLIEARMARHRNVVLWEFTRCLPDLSNHAKNVLFDVFSESSRFGVLEHNKLLDTLADPKKGWNLHEAEMNYRRSHEKSYRPI